MFLKILGFGGGTGLEMNKVERISNVEGNLVRNRTWKLLSLQVISLVLASFALASEPQEIQPEELSSSPQIFTQWKQAQITEAHNYAVRMRNRLHLVSSQTGEVSQTPNHLIKLTELKQEVEEAQERLALAQELSLDAYFDVYLQQFKNNPLALQQLSEKIPPEEILTLLGRLLKTKTPQPSASPASPVAEARVQ